MAEKKGASVQGVVMSKVIELNNALDPRENVDPRAYGFARELSEQATKRIREIETNSLQAAQKSTLFALK